MPPVVLFIADQGEALQQLLGQMALARALRQDQALQALFRMRRQIVYRQLHQTEAAPLRLLTRGGTGRIRCRRLQRTPGYDTAESGAEAFGGFQKPDIAFVDQLQVAEAVATVSAGHTDDKAQVGARQLVQRLFITVLLPGGGGS